MELVIAISCAAAMLTIGLMLAVVSMKSKLNKLELRFNNTTPASQVVDNRLHCQYMFTPKNLDGALYQRPYLKWTDFRNVRELEEKLERMMEYFGLTFDNSTTKTIESSVRFTGNNPERKGKKKDCKCNRCKC